MFKLFLFDMDGVFLQHRSSWQYCQEAIGCDCEHFYDEFELDVLNGKDLTELVLEKMMRYGFSQAKLLELAHNAPQMRGVGKVMEAIRSNHGSVVVDIRRYRGFRRGTVKTIPDRQICLQRAALQWP